MAGRSSEFIRTQFSVIGYPLMGRAEFVAVPGWNGRSLTVWFRISKRHTRRVKSEMSKSAKIELCVTKLRLSGLGVGFFDRNI